MYRSNGGGTVKTSLIIILLFPLMSYGQSHGVVTDEYGNPVSRSPGTGTEEQSSSTAGLSGGSSDSDSVSDGNLEDNNGFENTASGARENAAASSSSSGFTQMLGMAMGAAFMSGCNAHNPMNCVLGAMSFIDAAASGGNKGNSINFENSLLPTSGVNGEVITAEVTEAEIMAQEAQAQLQALEAMGYVANPDGSINTPGGKTFSGGDFSSPGALENKGLNSAQAQAALDLLKSTKDKAIEDLGESSGNGGRAIASVGGSGGGGGSSASSLPDLIIDGESSGGRRKNKKNRGAGRMPADQATKLSKNFHGTPIGISIADIFLIVKKKYQEKDSKQEFINKEY